ncbi:MAG: hypothetical protein HC821_02460 [Lewinella sp.]|nr:hypothetical protein [Lewinella sp.]
MKSLPYIFVYFLVVTLLGCSAGTYGEAQRAFSAGATMNNAALLGIDLTEETPDLDDLFGPAQPDPAANNAQAQFAVARDKLIRLLRRPARLAKVNLLGNVHTLLGLTEWQLGNHLAATSQANEALAAFGDSTATAENSRDLALAQALGAIVTLSAFYDSVALLPPTTRSSSQGLRSQRPAFGGLRLSQPAPDQQLNPYPGPQQH